MKDFFLKAICIIYFEDITVWRRLSKTRNDVKYNRSARGFLVKIWIARRRQMMLLEIVTWKASKPWIILMYKPVIRTMENWYVNSCHFLCCWQNVVQFLAMHVASMLSHKHNSYYLEQWALLFPIYLIFFFFYYMFTRKEISYSN